MLKPIITKNQIKIEGVIYLVKNYYRLALQLNLLFCFIFLLYFLIKPTVYHSKVSFYSNYNEAPQTSFLSMLPAGMLGGGLGYTSLSFSIPNYLVSENFLLGMVNDEYTIDEHKFTLTDKWGKNYNNFWILNPIAIIKRINFNLGYNRNLTDSEKKEVYASTMLKNSITFSEDRRSLLNTISINIKGDSEIGKQIIEKAYDSIVNYSSNVVNVKATEKKEFISKRLSEIQAQLDQAENAMLKFSQENKQIENSPSLTLTKQRLQKDITLYNQLFFTLSDQLELAKINEKDNTTSFFLLDEPTTKKTSQEGSFAYNLIKNLIVFNLLLATILIIRKRTDLIHL